MQTIQIRRGKNTIIVARTLAISFLIFAASFLYLNFKYSNIIYVIIAVIAIVVASIMMLLVATLYLKPIIIATDSHLQLNIRFFGKYILIPWKNIAVINTEYKEPIYHFGEEYTECLKIELKNEKNLKIPSFLIGVIKRKNILDFPNLSLSAGEAAHKLNLIKVNTEKD